MLTGEQLIILLRDKFGDTILEAKEPVSLKVYVTIPKEAVTKIVDFIYNELEMRFLINAGTDRRPFDNDFLVTYIFSKDEDKLFLILQVPVNKDELCIDSITPIIPGADWSERETQDLLGIKVKGHPDPRRLILSDDWPGELYPLRKDFVYNYKPPSAEGFAPQLKEPPEGATCIPVGPFFPVLEEPWAFRVFVEGETVVGCDYRAFYVHRGIEKLGDSHLTYNQIPFIAERICGICGYIHSCCYCQAVEEAAKIEVPLRAKYIRSIMLELERIHSHILWVGLAGHIIGFDTVLHQTWRMREPIMWLCERITGHRKTYGMNLIGGVRRDIPKEVHQDVLGVLLRLEKEWLTLIDAIQGDTPLMMRLKDVGMLPNLEAKKICVTGPTARGSGVEIDSRVDHPYAAYDLISPQKIVHSEGDTLARTLVRLEEVLEAIREIRVCLKGMSEGSIYNPPKEEIPPGLEGVSVVEAPRGEAIHYVITGEENKPYRWKVRAPTYANLQAIPGMIQDGQFADMPIILGSIDPCFSCTSRLEVVDVKSGKAKFWTQEELMRISRNSGRSAFRHDK